MSRTLFLAVEGCDGVGKTTLVNKLAEILRNRGIDTRIISSGDNLIDKAISKLKNDGRYDIKGHFFLAMANSILTYNDTVNNDFSSSETIVYIFDRYFYTTIAYNVALGLDFDWCWDVASVIQRPDIVIYCDLPVAEVVRSKKAFERIEVGFKYGDDVQKSFCEYQMTVKNVYERIINLDSSTYLRINTDEIGQAVDTVISCIEPYLESIDKDNEIIRLASYLRNVEIKKESEELGSYKTAVLVCLDAVLSINRKYYQFVVPRIKYFMENYSEITTLSSLYDILLEEGEISRYWNYNHKAREKTLKELVAKFLEIVKEYPDETEIEALKKWSSTVSVDGYKRFGVHGIGIATFQYLRLLLGASTVKPDVHIKRAVSTALGRRVGDIEVISLFETACDYIHIPAKIMDHSLWLQMAQNVNEEYEWKDGRWKGIL